MNKEGTRLLIVEDDLATLFALRTLFGQRGWEVTAARTVAEAMAHLSEATPDWIILDLWLPDGDGEDILRSVRQASLATRVVVISAALDEERVVRLLGLRADLLMPKPIDFLRLFTVCLGLSDRGCVPDSLDLVALATLPRHVRNGTELPAPVAC